MLLVAGTRLGSYEIIEAIGEGGIGACGWPAERVFESRRALRRGGGAPRQFLMQTDLAYARVRGWD